MSIIDFNDSGISGTVLTLTRRAKGSLESARGVFSGIKVPSDFKDGNIVKNSPMRIYNIEEKLMQAETNINTSISKFELAQRMNNSLVNNMISSIGKTSAIYSVKKSRYTKNTPNKAKKINYTGKIDTSEAKDGCRGTYINSIGLKFNDYKQGEGPWKNEEYYIKDENGEGKEYKINGLTVHSNPGDMTKQGCGATSVAIIASGLVNKEITPSDARESCLKSGSAYEYSRVSIAAGLKNLGIKTKLIDFEKSDGYRKVSIEEAANTIKDVLKENKVMVCVCEKGTIFCQNVSHAVTVVDFNEKENKVFVMNPDQDSAKSGWYAPEELKSRYIIVADMMNTNEMNSLRRTI